MLDAYGVKLIGAQVEAIEKAEDRQLFKQAMQKIGLARAAVRATPTAWKRRAPSRRRWRRRPASAYPVLLRPSFTLGGSGAAIVWNADEFDAKVHVGPAAEPARRGPGRAVGARLEGVRAGGDARQERQRRHHLLDRELRPDGRAHGRLDHRRARDDADRQGVPDHARRGPGRHPRDRRRDRRLEHPVRDQPGERPDDRHRDEPARVAQLGAGVQGDRVPDREDRGQAGGRLHAGRAPQRHHARDAGLLRADHRLRRHQGAALRVREVPGRRRRAAARR